jgi:hypothetical protein
MVKSQGQGTENKKNQNVDSEDREGTKLPVPTTSEPPKDLTGTKYDIVGKTDVDPEKVAKNVQYEDEGFSEAGLLNDDI